MCFTLGYLAILAELVDPGAGWIILNRHFGSLHIRLLPKGLRLIFSIGGTAAEATNALPSRLALRAIVDALRR